MLVTVHSQVVDSDVLIPSAEGIEDTEIKIPTPWIFENSHIADTFCTEHWPMESGDFRDFFWLLNSYYTELNEPGTKDIVCDMNASQTISLPKKNWKVSSREYFAHLMRSQGMMLRVLMGTIYHNLENGQAQESKIHFPVSGFKQVYVIGGQRHSSIPDGAAMIGPRERRLPIISFAGTWSEFLAEILSIMLGQLARNLSGGYEDQEVFVIGFYERCIYIARGLFGKELISRVHVKGCTQDDTVELQFTRGYDLSLREDWFEAISALAKLLRYLLSGNAKMSALKAYLHKAADPAECL
ncbi:hypothetical protein BDV37DRAFT_295455 [Aspergillus pseudonomiae]|uniref:Fungal-type protein kinase domain-containing protein n=1 Tax=Aspergillus pseudonomiae TaxID=1506151 RepID=A0A5N7D8K9_9EURO|nr:uncharacterized protein BDV37DRAFT_295455 [Aspergillus pseudonomiae]KAE8402303.1 hypothetical protein BDV37DRAFT_295455 [Aspergillus pseudonomiae]